MTTSDPRADRRDDTPHEHRGLGKRILEAVLGDPADDRRDDPADTRRDDPDRTTDRPAGTTAEGFGGDGPRREYSSYEQATRDSGYVDDGRRDAGYDDPVARAAGHEPGDPGRDPLAPDAPHDIAAAGYEDRRPADRASGYGTTAAAATGSGLADRSGAGQDFVTGSYDPDRDRGYDPQAAGTAVETDPAQGPGARHTRRDADHDVARDTGYVDDPRAGAAPDYDPAQDTGYVDVARAEADRTTGRRDDDYDTGRVDADRQDRTVDQPGDRVATEPVDRDRADTNRADTNRGANTAAAAGAAAAAAFGSSDREGSDRDTRFSEVDDTVTVDATDTGRRTPDTGSVTGEAGVADEDGASGGRERLVPAERADEYGSRWDALKGDFVDEPRRAVRQADELVGEVLDELQRLFADQRRGLEQSFDHDQASTEDLRLALRRYRSFFDRLLSF